MPSNRPTVAILYGFGEGPGVAKRLLPELTNAGLNVTRDVKSADYIITHSSGCYDVPNNNQSKKILYICPSSYRHIGVVRSGLRKLIQDVAFAITSSNLVFWAYKTARNLIYVTIQPHYSLRVIAMAFQKKEPLLIKAGAIEVVGYTKDPWKWQVDPAKDASRCVYHEYNKPHDDIWYNPKMYVDMLASSR